MLEFGFVWRESLEAAKNAVAPEHSSHNLHLRDLFMRGSRSIVAYHILNSNPNEVLGGLVAGRPTKEITGSFCIHAMNDDEDLQDVLPSDLHEATYFVALVERKYGPVKIALDPCIEAQYA